LRKEFDTEKLRTDKDKPRPGRKRGYEREEAERYKERSCDLAKKFPVYFHCGRAAEN